MMCKICPGLLLQYALAIMYRDPGQKTFAILHFCVQLTDTLRCPSVRGDGLISESETKGRLIHVNHLRITKVRSGPAHNRFHYNA